VFGSGSAGPTMGEPNKPSFNFTSNTTPQPSFDFTNGNQVSFGAFFEEFWDLYRFLVFFEFVKN
jgi:hypothetical protein